VASRTYYQVPLPERSFVVPADSRVFVVPSTGRTPTLPPTSATATAALAGHGHAAATALPRVHASGSVAGHGVLHATDRLSEEAVSVGVHGHGVLTATAAAYSPPTPPVFDSAGAGFVNWSHTLTDLATILLVGAYPPAGSDVVGTTRTATWGSTPMTSLGAMELYTQPGNSWLEVFVLMNPEPGTNTITLDNSASANTRGVSVAYQNVLSYSPLVASAGPGGSTGLLDPSDSIVTGSIPTSTGEIAVAFFAAEDGDIVLGSATTQASSPPTNSNLIVQDMPGTGGDVVFTNNLGGFKGFNEWAAYGLTVSSAAPVTPPSLTPPTFGTAGPDINTGSPPPWTHTTSAGDYVFVPIVIGDSGTDVPSIDVITFAGEPMTLLGSPQIFDTNGATGFLLFLYGYADAPAGTNTITFEPGAGTWQYAATSVSCVNVGGVAPLLGITEGGGGTDTTLGQELTCPAGDLIVQVFATTEWTLSSPTGGTNEYLGPATNGSGPTLAVNIATSDTIFTAAINHNDYWASVAVVLSGA
jgi:hypothetical protein